MAKETRPFNRDELEAKVAAYENLSRNMKLSESSRTYFRNRAKTIRSLLAVTDRLWGKPKTGRRTETEKDIERR